MSAVYARCIRRFLYTLSRVEISVYAVYPDTCGRSYPYIFVYADVTVSEAVFFRARFSKMAASRNVVFNATVFLLIETFFMGFFNRKFFSLFKLTRVETSSKQTRKPRIWRQNYRRLSFLCNAHALLTNPLRCPDTNRIRVDGRIRFVYATCGRRY